MSEPGLDDLVPRRRGSEAGASLCVGESSIGNAELRDAVRAMAGRLRGLDRVAVWATSSLATCVGVLGGLAAGAVVIPINPRSGRRELQHIVDDSAPDCLLAPAGEELPDIVATIPGAGADEAGIRAARRPPRSDDTVMICYTSGTTGLPKGVQIPWRAIEWNLDALAKIWAWTGEDQVCHALPLYHVHGLVLGLLGAMRRRSRLEIVPRFSVDGVAAAVDRGATILFGVPTMYHRIAEDLERSPERAGTFARLRLMASGSAALPASEHQRLERLVGRAIVERYGLTESLICLGVRVGDPPRPGSVGHPLPGAEVRLVDDEGVVIDSSDSVTIGGVEVRSPGLFNGYLNAPEATRAALRNGWLVTGDLATRDADGAYRIVGRRSTDLIKSGGFRIGAGEIENALLEHPAVGEAAVVGRPDPDLGERVVAWVVPAPSRSPEPTELMDHVRSLLAPHKVPRQVHVVAALPRNAMGKVMKSALTEPQAEPRTESEGLAPPDHGG